MRILKEANTFSNKANIIDKYMKKYPKNLKLTNYEDDAYNNEIEEKAWLASLTYDDICAMSKEDRDDLKKFIEYRDTDMGSGIRDEYTHVYDLLDTLEQGTDDEDDYRFVSETEEELDDLYVHRIQGHTKAEYDLGIKVYEFDWNREKNMTPDERAQNLKLNLNDRMNKMIQEFIDENPQYDFDEAADALSLVYACEEYSDLHKYAYGRRFSPLNLINSSGRFR